LYIVYNLYVLCDIFICIIIIVNACLPSVANKHVHCRLMTVRLRVELIANKVCI